MLMAKHEFGHRSSAVEQVYMRVYAHHEARLLVVVERCHGLLHGYRIHDGELSKSRVRKGVKCSAKYGAVRKAKPSR